MELLRIAKKAFDYKRRKFQGLQYVAPTKNSLATLKQEQFEEKEKRKLRRKKKLKKKHSRLQKKFKPTTNLHTIRICLYKVIIPTSIICLFCIIGLHFVSNAYIFIILSMLCQMLTFIQISALYTSMLWCIGIGWQAFACGVGEIGWHLAGDGIAPGLISNVLLGDEFKNDIYVLIVVMVISIFIFVAVWKFVDYQIWNITQNSSNSKFFKLLYEETTFTSSSLTSTTNSSDYHNNNNQQYNNGHESDPYGSSDNSYDRDSGIESTNEHSEYDSASDWNPGNY